MHIQRFFPRLGFRCNNHCSFCNQRNIDLNRRYLNTQEAINMISWGALNITREAICFCSGEFCIREDAIILLAHTKKIGFKSIFVSSNGRIFSYINFTKEIIQAGANRFSITLLANSSKVHDALTTIDGSFEQTVKGIKNLKRLGQKPIIDIVITNYNYQNLPSLVKFLVNSEINDIQFYLVNMSTFKKKIQKKFMPKLSLLKPYLTKAISIALGNGNSSLFSRGIPPCCIGKFDKYIKFDFESGLRTSKSEKETISIYRKKALSCTNCTYNNICYGTWKEYLELYGDNELTPIR